MMRIFSFRAREEMIKEAEKLAALENIDKSIVLREALEKGLAQIKLEIAVKLFSEERLSVGEAADIADVSAGEIMEELVKRGIHSKINLEDVKENLQTALKHIK